MKRRGRVELNEENIIDPNDLDKFGYSYTEGIGWYRVDINEPNELEPNEPNSI